MAAEDESFSWPNGQPPQTDGSNFPYIHPTAYCAPDPFMYPVQTLSVNQKMVDDWLADAPMPYDIRFDRAAVNVSPPSNSSVRMNPSMATQTQTQKYTPGRPTESQSRTSFFSRFGRRTPPYSAAHTSDFIDLGPLNLNERVSPEPAVVHVWPSDDVTLRPNIRIPSGNNPWCKVHYYEFKQRIGNQFDARQNTFTIDGATGNSDEHRLSLSAQPPSKAAKSGQVRNLIGSGIKLTYRDGTIMLNVLSNQTTFVQCPYHNYLNGVPIETVLRLRNDKGEKDANGIWVAEEQATVKLFNLRNFNQMKEHARGLAYKEAYRLLYSFCSTRISFIKGFGTNYGGRAAYECASWLELHVSEAYDSLDGELINMNYNSLDINSRSLSLTDERDYV
ncbi:unnamed protein product [Caenorhabditis sp. 36 PRJEB53466]|nr:unnamed protein product [Caenorhabditis sp. 36 PRJEB53466]